MKADVVIGLAYGDEAKGKVTHHLLKHDRYDFCCRTSGGANAGHTIYHNGQKLITHLIPAGVFFDVPSLIGPGCFVHPQSFFQEIEYLEKAGIPANSLVKIAHNAHIVTQAHLDEEKGEDKIGTTRRGIGPASRDKAARIGKRAEDIPELKDYLIDFYETIHVPFNDPDRKSLFEGAQGFYLDPHFGDYPYVTSSHCGVASVLLNGVSHRSLNRIYGVTKAYETYVGLAKFEGDDPVFPKMRELGNEYGATTGRPRQCNFLDLDKLMKAVHINGVTDLVINKMDVMRELDCWKVRGELVGVVDLGSEYAFRMHIKSCVKNVNVIFSYSPEAM